MPWSSEKISGFQAFMIMIGAGIGNIFVVISGSAVRDAGRDGWIAVLVAYFLATVFGFILIHLGLKFPDKTFVQYLPEVIGKIPGKLAGLYYILGWWLMSGLIIRETIELVRLILPHTPPIYVNIIFSSLVIYTMKKGFEGFARVTEAYSFILVTSLVVSMLMLLPSLNFEEVRPVLANGVGPVFKALRVQFPYAMETVLFMSLWLPCLSYGNKSKKVKRAVIWGIPISGALLTFFVIINITLLGLYLTENHVFQAMRIFRYISIRNFISGFDVIFMLVWVASSYLQILVFFYQPVVGLAQWLNLKDYKALVVPMVLINSALAMIPSNVTEVIKLDMIKNIVIILPIALLIPVTWVVALIRKSGVKYVEK